MRLLLPSRPQPGHRMGAASLWRGQPIYKMRLWSRTLLGKTLKRLARSQARPPLPGPVIAPGSAYIDGDQALSAGTIGPLHVVDLETSKEMVEDGNIIAFFWSPSGKEIAYFILLQANADSSGGSSSGSGSAQTTPQYVLQLHVLDVTTGESRELFTYQPTQQFLSVLPYFDQYHQSVTIWSPDNNNLVLSFLDNSGNPGIAVVAASGKLQPRILAQGYLASGRGNKGDLSSIFHRK